MVSDFTRCQIPAGKLCARSSEKRETDCLVGIGFISQLSDSIEKHGLMNALRVQLPGTESQGEWYRVIFGIRRLEAIKLLILQKRGGFTQKTEVPCIVQKVRLSDSEITKQRTLESRWQPSAEEQTVQERVNQVDNLYQHQREMIAELVRLGRLDVKIDRDCGKMISVSTPRGNDDAMKRYFDMETTGLTGQPQWIIMDESSPMPDIGPGGLYNAYKSQIENRAYRPTIPVQYIDIRPGDDVKIMEALKNKRAIIEGSMDFAGFEIRYANFVSHGYGVEPQYHVPTRYFDLGENW